MTQPFNAQAIRSRGDDSRLAEYPPVPEAVPRPLYDNHTHLEFAAGTQSIDPLLQLDLAQQAGIAGVVQVGTDLATSQWSAALAANDPRVLAAVALHPNEAPKLAEAGLLDAHLEGIDALAKQPRVRAVGETGLDFFRTEGDGQAAQFTSFEAHIEIAKRHNLAMQIHDRDAHTEVFQTLTRVGAPERTVFHCFSGSAEFAAECAQRGWYLSFSGTVTFKNSQGLRDALRVVPLSQVLVETDAPFLTPVPFRGKPNASYLIGHTARCMADVLGLSISVLADQLVENTVAVYGSWEQDAPVAASSEIND